MIPPYKLIYTGAVSQFAGYGGLMSTVFAEGFFWGTYEWLANGTGGSARLYILKISPGTGQVVSSANLNLNPYYFNVRGNPQIGYSPATGYLIVTDRDPQVPNWSFVFRAKCSTFPGSGIQQLGSASLGYGFPFNMGSTPDGDVWSNYNGVRRITPNPLALTATVAGTAGVGGGTTYDPVNGFIWACGGGGTPTTIWKINPATNTVVDSIVTAGARYDDIIFAFKYLWATDIGHNIIVRIDPVTKVLTPIVVAGTTNIGADISNLATALNTNPETMKIINPKTLAVIQITGAVFPLNQGGVVGTTGNPMTGGFITGNQNKEAFAWSFLLGKSEGPNKIHLGSKPKMRMR